MIAASNSITADQDARYPIARVTGWLAEDALQDAQYSFACGTSDQGSHADQPVGRPDWISTVHEKLDSMHELVEGWNGYSAPAPDQMALNYAYAFVSVLGEEGIEPDRVAPSVIGGVGITFRCGNRKAYLEIMNGGIAHLALIHGDDIKTEPARMSDRNSLKSLAWRAYGFLNG